MLGGVSILQATGLRIQPQKREYTATAHAKRVARVRPSRPRLSSATPSSTYSSTALLGRRSLRNTKTATMIRRPISRDDFPIAIICALKVEYDAVCLLINWWGDGDWYGAAEGDDNTYKTGRMGNVNIVLVRLPRSGNSMAAAATARLQLSFPQLKLVLLVGVCGGAPRTATDREMLLGDVIIGDDIVQYDHGRRYPDDFRIRHHFGGRFGGMTGVRSLITALEAEQWRERLENQASGFLEQLQQRASRGGKRVEYGYPGTAHDRLFEPGYRHKHQQSIPHACVECRDSPGAACEMSRGISCEELGCNDNSVVPRSRLETKRCLEEHGLTDEAQAPVVFLGRFGSADTVMKSAAHRDEIAKQHGILAFEMEGAGVSGQQLPCIVVKGVCDYADSHKDKAWQKFAAATAASVARALVEHHSQPLVAGVQRRPNRVQRSFCSRCDLPGHKLGNCWASKETVEEGRARRDEEDRCWNCGASDHWVRDCPIQEDLLDMGVRPPFWAIYQRS